MNCAQFAWWLSQLLSLLFNFIQYYKLRGLSYCESNVKLQTRYQGFQDFACLYVDLERGHLVVEKNMKANWL